MALEQLSGGGAGAQSGTRRESGRLIFKTSQRVKEIMMDNIEKVLDQGEKIEVLVDKTEALGFQADNFPTRRR